MMRKTTKKILSLALAAVLVAGLFPAGPLAPQTAFADMPTQDSNAIGEVWDGVHFGALFPIDNNGSMVYSGIYYGSYDHATDMSGSKESDNNGPTSTPVLWRVMGEEPSDGKLTLLSEYVLDAKPFYPYNTYNGSWVINKWEDSYINKWLNNEAFISITDNSTYNKSVGSGFLDGFQNAELDAVNLPNAITTKYQDGSDTNHSITLQKIWLPATNNWANSGGAGDVSWYADLSSVIALGNNAAANKATLKNATGVTWWLRSPGSTYSDDALCVNPAGFVGVAFVLTTPWRSPRF